MKLQSLILAAILSTSFGSAMAVDYTSPTIVLEAGADNWTADFGTSHTIGNFTDTFTFSYSGVSADATGFVRNVQNKKSNIDFYSATLNGVALDLANGAKYSDIDFADLPVNGTLTLVITGKATGDIASYAGTIDVTSAVPEPTTYGMLLGGLGVVGFLARRRKA
ncbi:FxDxF family PEP-CTERM protein [Pseudoduganella dura]|uniref:FxDxF family PEP-CTERM protein n=1 Tax=Pseudoduganella dura TaxID=321982 RepID=UPI00198C9476|nr:FxDxF family PEP-CTERM protein [Pseudoduganella dura]GGY09096.1 hypothetical protein GCM10007386_44530 [Pseudoduganella dura]